LASPLFVAARRCRRRRRRSMRGAPEEVRHDWCMKRRWRRIRRGEGEQEDEEE